jgi:hypothetical protein
MRQFVKYFLISIPVLLLTGCLNIETNVTVNKDGSGTINETVLMSRMFADMLAEFTKSFGDSADTEEFSLFDEAELINAASEYGEGVKYVSGEHISNDQWEGFKATYSFSDLNKIKLKPDPDSKVSVDTEESEIEPQSEEYYFFKFTGGDVSTVLIDRPEIRDDFESEPEEEFEAEEEGGEMDEQFLNMMEGMSMNITIQFDGEIVETNASYVDGSKVTLLGIDFGELLKDRDNLKLFKQKQPQSVEELKEMVEKVPGMKLELQKPVKVIFK